MKLSVGLGKGSLSGSVCCTLLDNMQTFYTITQRFYILLDEDNNKEQHLV